MKRYKLLKDLPTFKAGEEFFISDSGNLIAGTPSNPKQITVETEYGIPKKIDLMAYAQETLEEFPNILTDWFREIKETKIIMGEDNVVKLTFETKEEAKKYIEYFKAKTVIQRDTKGFLPDWSDLDEPKYYGIWNFNINETNHTRTYGGKQPDICFKTEKDIEESFEKHPEEWKIYLFYEL